MKRRKKDDAELRKDELLDISYRFFLEKGFDKFSMDDLAKKIGCARRSIYTYFKSKNDIYMALYLRNTVLKINCLKEVVKGNEDPDIILSKFLNEYYKLSSEHKEFVKFQLKMDSSDFDWNLISEEYKTEYSISSEEYFEILTRLMQRGIDMGIFRSGIHPRVMFAEVMFSMRGVLNRCILFPEQTYVIARGLVSAEEFFQNYIIIIIDGLRDRSSNKGGNHDTSQ